MQFFVCFFMFSVFLAVEENANLNGEINKARDANIALTTEVQNLHEIVDQKGYTFYSSYFS